MTAALTGVVELLDRALAYTRVILADVRTEHLAEPTPCRAWDLAALLAHMDDSLDAFVEAAGGTVSLAPARTHDVEVGVRVDRLQTMACALLGIWSGPAPAGVRIGDADLATEVLVATAALEITVHGWDVGRVTSGGPGVPDELAERLLPWAHDVVAPADRGIRFAAALPSDPSAGPSARLLGFLGRR